MARTLTPSSGRKQAAGRGRAKRRERPLGAAVGLALAVMLGVAVTIFVVQLLLPSSSLHNMYLLAHFNSSPTLRDDPLFQQWMGDINREEALFVEPLTLLCGGLTLGWLAPAYAGRGRVLRAAALLAFGLIAVSLAFVWPATILQQNRLNEVGGHIVRVGIPPELIARQALVSVLWIGVCVLGAWASQHLRAKAAPRS